MKSLKFVSYSQNHSTRFFHCRTSLTGQLPFPSSSSFRFLFLHDSIIINTNNGGGCTNTWAEQKWRLPFLAGRLPSHPPPCLGQRRYLKRTEKWAATETKCKHLWWRNKTRRSVEISISSQLQLVTNTSSRSHKMRVIVFLRSHDSLVGLTSLGWLSGISSVFSGTLCSTWTSTRNNEFIHVAGCLRLNKMRFITYALWTDVLCGSIFFLHGSSLSFTWWWKVQCRRFFQLLITFLMVSPERSLWKRV